MGKYVGSRPDGPSDRSHMLTSAGSMILLHDLADEDVTVDIGRLDEMIGTPYDLLVDGPYDRPDRKLRGLELHGYGCHWIRLCRSDRP